MGIIDSSAHPTLVHVLRQRATEHPDKVAFEYLGQRSETNASDRELSYGSLDGKARAIAARLVEAGGQNEPVMLLFRPGLDFISAFLGCLYARAFAVPAYPPAGGSGRGLVRLQAVLSDCGARIVLTDGEAFSQESAPELGSPLWIRTDDLPATAVDSLPDLEADDLAFLQYTSGSTGSPRGVMVSHGNLMHNLAAIRQAFAGDPEKDRGVFWLPQYHDMGLIGGLLLTCWAGCCLLH